MYHEAIGCAFDSWGIVGPVRALLSKLLNSKCRMAGVKGFPSSEAFPQERGISEGAPEAPIVFLLPMAWWEAGKAAWEALHPASPEVEAFRRLEAILIPLKDVTYADDKNQFHLSEATAQRDADYIHQVGPPVGLVLNIAKCIARRILADNAFTRGESSFPSLNCKLGPPDISLGGVRMPTEGDLKILGGGVFGSPAAMPEIRRGQAEAHHVTRELRILTRGGSMHRLWMMRLVERVIGWQ